MDKMAYSCKLTFVELMKQQPSYGPLMDKPVKYQLTALYNGTYWSLAIKEDQSDLPYVTIEVISDDGKTIVRAVRKVDYKEDELSLLKPMKIGTYGPDKTLTELCQIADEIFKEIYTSEVITKEVSKDKRQAFTSCLVAKAGFKVHFTTTPTTYYTIEVASGSGFQTCYLGTQNNDMRFPTDFPDGNISVYWNCDPSAFESSIINAVTEQSPIPTYMVLGATIKLNPQTYQVTLNGLEKNFDFTNSTDVYGAYAITTRARDGSMTYLKPNDQNSGEIVAVAQTPEQFLFRITRTTLPIPPTSMWHRESKAQQLHLQSHL